jgi:ribosomal protein L11 methyltransferase
MSQATWIEVELIVDGELAEAVAEVLGRFVSGGVVIESTAVAASDDDSQGQAIGPLRVCGYLPVDDQLEENRRRLEEALWYLGRIRPLPAPQFRTVQEQDWSQAWKQHYKPILIGARLVVVPAWQESPDPGRVAVRMDPGMAFGTGTHPTTQLCLELLEACLPTNASSVIDVGCGSGILAVAALKLGAQAALGVDIDAEAVEATQANAELNGVEERLEVKLGSVTEILGGGTTLRRAPLVLANILAPVIIRLLEDGLANLLDPGGVLILSGILDEQTGEVEDALRARGLSVLERRQIGDWVALAVHNQNS